MEELTTPKIDVLNTIKDSLGLCLKNFFKILLTMILYIVTIWIPWLNVGTTVGIYKMAISLSKGEDFSPTDIFDKENFCNISNVFVLMAIMFVALFASVIFMIVPVIIMSIAWMFAIYLLLDKDVKPIDSLKLSYDITYGEKWRIFFVELLVGIIAFVAGLVSKIPHIGVLLGIIVSLFTTCWGYAVSAVLYRHFSPKADALIAPAAAPEEKCDAPEVPATPAE